MLRRHVRVVFMSCECRRVRNYIHLSFSDVASTWKDKYKYEYKYKYSTFKINRDPSTIAYLIHILPNQHEVTEVKISAHI